MEIILHKINTINELQRVDSNFGVEIDVRAYGSDLILNHEPYENGDKLIDYLNEYRHGTIIINIKESGIEDDVLDLITGRHNIKNYFLLDVELPYLINASKAGQRNIAVRFSEMESIDSVKYFINKVDWVWIDTITDLPIYEQNRSTLNSFKKCLVCPERWGRPNDIESYKDRLKMMNFTLDAVMTDRKYAKLWAK
jgi:hypothetical protein